MANNKLAPALYVVSTPIGNARDITLRALDVLKDADVLAAEDTRNARKLMEIHGIGLKGRKILAYHDHNGAAQRPKVLQLIADGKSVAYVSDAGTPLVADPGYALVRDALLADLSVIPVPGASAPMAALVASGLPSDRFLFSGFLPPSSAARCKELEGLKSVKATLIFFETGRRLSDFLRDCVAILGPDRPAAIGRELTKRFEEMDRGTLGELATRREGTVPKGELVVLVGKGSETADPEDRDELLRDALRTLSVKDAAAQVADVLGLPKREVYQAALTISRETP